MTILAEPSSQNLYLGRFFFDSRKNQIIPKVPGLMVQIAAISNGKQFCNLYMCFVVNFDFTEWVYIQNIQHAVCKNKA